MKLSPYIAAARIDNWTKNLLMFAGAGLAYVLSGFHTPLDIRTMLLTLVSLCLASSANYVLNEFLDVASDACHPIKKQRPFVTHSLSKNSIMLEYLLLVISAVAISHHIHPDIFYVTCVYIACAWAYNIPPVRIKDVAYGDVLLESINYPLRLLLGWLCLLPNTPPPSSLLLIGWSIGAFAMSLKRLAEYQLFASPAQAQQYRKSYAVYTTHTLAVSGFIYAMITLSSMTIFMLKYKTELVLLIPLLIVWMAWYFLMGLKQNLCIIYPERLLKNKMFFILTIVTAVAAIMLVRMSLPWLDVLNEPLRFYP